MRKHIAHAQVVKAPGNLVISAYVTCPDITLTVTPDLKLPGSGKLLWVDLGGGRKRLGGSALAHAYRQVQCTPNLLKEVLRGFKGNLIREWCLLNGPCTEWLKSSPIIGYLTSHVNKSKNVKIFKAAQTSVR